MAIRIERRGRGAIPFNIEKSIRKLLSTVPPDHLIGLETIVILDQIKDKSGPGVGGRYWQKWDRRPATIEIALETTYGRVSRLWFFFPLFARLVLATVLYHELGHHYHHVHFHGVTKQEREQFAEQYKKHMVKRAFARWFFVLRLVNPLIRWLNRRLDRQEALQKQQPQTRKKKTEVRTARPPSSSE